MIWLWLGLIFLIASWISNFRNKVSLENYFDLGFLLSLLLWLAAQVDLINLGVDEESLLQWFAIGLLFLIIKKTGHLFFAISPTWSLALDGTAAFSYALGFHVFRPDAYAKIPASIMAFLVLILAIRAGKRLIVKDNPKAIFIIMQIAVFALMLYASFYKIMDRVWQLPWSYMVAIGAILFSLSQLWRAWIILKLSTEDWHGRISVSTNLAQLLIIVAAYYHYSQYL